MTTFADSAGVDGLTFSQLLARTVNRFGGHDALVFPQPGYRCTYAQFRYRVREVARALMALGVEAGEHIGIWAPNRPAWVLTQFAAAEAGAVLVNINPAYRAHELQYVLNQADITTLLLADRTKHADFFGILAEVCPEINTAVSDGEPGPLQTAACPRLRHGISITEEHPPGLWTWNTFRQLAERVSEAELDARQSQLGPDDVVNIQYTSGTTGFPKGAMLTHRNLLLNAYHVGQRLHADDRDRICIPVPFYHCFGCVLGTLLCAVYGAAMVIPAETFDPLATLKAVAEERATALYGVPTMFIAQLHHPRFEEFDLSSLRKGIMAGSPCPIEIMRAVVERMGARGMTIAYGLTEASPVITQTEVTDDLEQRVGTVGTPLPGLEVRIVGPGNDQALPAGMPGELMVRGHCVMRGYYNKPAETAAAITSDGWLHTGDLAVCTPDGYYRITGRIKDLIIRGGENIYPREIEEFLYTHPAVADVQVVGLPDEKLGEELCAWVRPKPNMILTEDELRTFCRGRIAHFKVPRYVVFVDEYPTTVTGKVQKFRLRELGVERFGLQEAAGIETA
jgi:fatty-acyl-CoA synthase